MPTTAPKFQFSLEDVTETEALDLTIPPTRVLLIIPGIRDANDLARTIEQIDPRLAASFRICPVDYGRFGRTMFLRGMAFRGPRNRAIARVIDDIERYERMFPTADFNALCYSNGTFLFSQAAHKLSKRWTNVAFLGSICTRSAAEDFSKRVTRFANFCGTTDPWPVLATTANPSLFGATGTIGFRSAINESYLPIGHYGATDPVVVKEFLYPFLAKNKIRNLKQRQNPAVYLHPDAIWRYLIWAGVAALALFVGFWLI